jgi:hypothetical protein
LRRRLSEGARTRVKARLWAWGLEPIRREPVDLRGLVSDPLEAWQRCRGDLCLVDVPPDRCRSMDLMGFACGLDQPHPFVLTAAGILDGSVTSYEASPLKAYYDGFQPRTVLDLYGWDPAAAGPALTAPTLCAANPWEDTPGPHMRAMRRRVNFHDSVPYGGSDGDDESYIDWGPATARKGELEFRRLSEVAASVLRGGYAPRPGRDAHIRGKLLVDGERSVISIGNGHHRIAVLTALGWPTVPVMIARDIVRRETVEDWPGVRSGALTPAQALDAFDIVLHGRRPPRPGCVLQPGSMPRSGAAVAQAGGGRLRRSRA